MDAAAHLTLLGLLAEATGGVHAPAALTRAIAEVLAVHLGARCFELGRVARGAGRIEAHRCDASDGRIGAVEAADRPLGASILDGPTAAPVLVLPVPRRPKVRAPEELRRAAAVGADHLVLLRLDQEEEGFALWAARGSPEKRGQGPLLEALRLLLRAALRSSRVVERVARLSQRAHRESRALRDELTRLEPQDELVVAGPSMRQVVEVVDLVAPQLTAVLLQGETGTGKELIARRIHRLSPRAGRPFLKVNCGAIPEALVESTLFGHERGAFTGALTRHRGVFERAHGGTLLLDEVGELPLSAQVKLLRVLQERECARVGSEAVLAVDVRVIAATHRPLARLVERGRFRADLYYRLNVFPILVPALRERLDELPILIERILDRICARLSVAVPAVPAAELGRLRAHGWPGNVRELENLLERSLLLAPGAALSLPADFLTAARGAPARPPRAVEPYDVASRACIRAALRACAGRIYGPAGAAERLGLKPTTLQSKMKKLGISRLGGGAAGT